MGNAISRDAVPSTLVGALLRAGLKMETGGLALLLAWQQRAFGFASMHSVDLDVSPLFAAYIGAACLGIFCLISYKFDISAFSRTWMIALVSVSACAGMLATVFLGFDALTGWADYLAGAVVGLASSAIMYAWSFSFAKMEANEAFAATLAAFGISSALCLITALTGDSVQVVTAVLLGLGTAACYVVVARREAGGDAAAATPDHRPVVVRPRRSHGYIYGLAVYAVVLGVTAGTKAAGSVLSIKFELDWGSAALGLAVCFLVALVWAVSKGRLGLAFFVRLSTPCIVVMLLSNVVFPVLSTYGSLVSECVWTLVRLFAFLLMLELARREEASIALLFPGVFSLLFLGFAVGELAGQVLFLHFGSDAQTVLYVDISLVVLAVVSASFLMGNWGSDLDSSVGTGKAPTPAPAHVEPANAAVERDDAVQTACARLVKAHGLSEREADVLGLLAKGHTRVSIAKRLFVSENTVRVHVKNIYVKLGIHSKQQLIDLLDK